MSLACWWEPPIPFQRHLLRAHPMSSSMQLPSPPGRHLCERLGQHLVQSSPLLSLWLLPVQHQMRLWPIWSGTSPLLSLAQRQQRRPAPLLLLNSRPGLWANLET